MPEKWTEKWFETEFKYSREYLEDLFAARVAIPEAAYRASDVGQVVQFARRLLRDAWQKEVARNADLSGWLSYIKKRKGQKA